MKMWIFAFAVVLAVFCVIGFVACGDGAGGPPGGDPPPSGDPLTLSGNITISPSYTENINTPLTANYSGHEAVSYHWEKDGSVIGGATSKNYTPTSAGIYYATVSATGYISKTSAPVTVNDPSLLTLSGTVTISPADSVIIGTQLTASYTGGSESVTYSWEKDGVALGVTTATYTPTTAGSYTVIVKATGYNEKVSNEVTVRPYQLGDTGPGGGKIFYISETGFTMTDTGETCHYLEAALNDMETDLRWCTTTDYLSPPFITGTEEVIGTGRKNTALILATDSTAPAAKACNDYTNNGKSDWFLPSKDELDQLYINRANVSNFNINLAYWSSSSSSSSIQNLGTYYVYAWAHILGMWGSEFIKVENHLVRAIRAF